MTGDHISSLEAERAVIGAILLDPTVCRETTQHVAPGDFGSVVLGQLYALMTGRAATGQAIDPVALWPAIKANEALSRSLRSAADLHTFMEATPTASNVAFYAKQVAEAGQSRRLLAASTRLAQLAHAADMPATDKLTHARREIEAIASDYAQTGEVPTLAEVLAVEDSHDWVIPGLLERMDRLVLTGGEGLGKAPGCGRLQFSPQPESTPLATANGSIRCE